MACDLAAVLTADAQIWVSWGVAAVWLLVHVVMMWRVVHARGITRGEWWLAVWVPPATVYLAWRIGMKRHVVLWGGVIVLGVLVKVALALVGLTIGAQLLLYAVLVLAAWLVAHLALLVRVLGVTGITSQHRWITIILGTPWVAWKHGMHRHVLLWGCLIAVYLALYAGLTLR